LWKFGTENENNLNQNSFTLLWFTDISGNTQMLSMSGGNIHSEENMPQQTYDQSSDCGSDIECFEKDDVIKQLKQELYEVNRENYYLKQQINDMEDVIEDNNMAIEWQNGQLAKFNNSFKVLEEENAEQLTKIGELTQELAEVMLDKLRLYTMIDMSKNFENIIKEIESEADEYRNKYEDSKSEIQRINKELEDINTENQKQKKEIQKLRKSRKYHEDDKNHHVSFRL
jgi:chromosome segregation ATPase